MVNPGRWFRRFAAAALAAGAMVLSAAPASRIALVAGPADEAARTGAEALAKAYGEAVDGGAILRVVAEAGPAFGDRLAGLAGDPLLKAVVVLRAPPGTAAAFARIHAKRKDILCLASEPQEPLVRIAATADLVVDRDDRPTSRALASAARRLGAARILYLATPGRAEAQARRRRDLEQACRAAGLRFLAKAAPEGREEAERFVAREVPAWIARLGQDTALCAASEDYTEPLIRQVAASGGLFLETWAYLPGLSGSLSLDLKAEAGNVPAILAKVEEAVKAKAAAEAAQVFEPGAGPGEFALRWAEGRAERSDLQQLLRAHEAWTPGVPWSGRPAPGRRNVLLVGMDIAAVGAHRGAEYLPLAP